MAIHGTSVRAESVAEGRMRPSQTESSVWLVTGDGQNKYLGRTVGSTSDGVVFEATHLVSVFRPGEPITLLMSRPIAEEPTPKTIHGVTEAVVLRTEKLDVGHRVTVRFRSSDD